MQVDEESKRKKRQTMLPAEIERSVEGRQAPNIINSTSAESNWAPRAQPSVQKVSLRDIEAHASNKQELYNLLTVQCQLYMPSIKQCSVAHMRSVLSGETRVFQNHEIVAINAPRFRELTVSQIFSQISNLPSIMAYLPSEVPADRLQRDFLFNIVNTITPSFFAKVIPAAEEKRIRPKSDDDLVHLDPKMLHLIKCFRVTRAGSKKGGLHLLKKNTKKRKKAQQQAAHDLAITVKDSLKDCGTEVDIFKRIQSQNFNRRLPPNQ